MAWRGRRQRHSGGPAASWRALMSGVDLGDTIDPLSAIHKALKAAHASGKLTDQQYTEKAANFWKCSALPLCHFSANRTWAESDRRDKRHRRAAVPQNFGFKSQDRSCPVVLSSNQNYKAERRDSCLGADGDRGNHPRLLANKSTPPVTRRIFFGKQNNGSRETLPSAATASCLR